MNLSSLLCLSHNIHRESVIFEVGKHFVRERAFLTMGLSSVIKFVGSFSGLSKDAEGSTNAGSLTTASSITVVKVQC